MEEDGGTSSAADDDGAPVTTYLLLAWVAALLVVIVALCAFIADPQRYCTGVSYASDHLTVADTPFRSDHRIELTHTNRLFTGYESVDFVGISLDHRKATHFERLKAQLARDQIVLTWFQGIDGKQVRLDDYNLSRRYRTFFDNNIKEREAGKTQTDYRGHLGCTLSHLGVLASARHMTVVLEDDAEVVPQFRTKFQ